MFVVNEKVLLSIKRIYKLAYLFLCKSSVVEGNELE